MTTDLQTLGAPQLDVLREVANIGAGHAATALSAMTGQTIMISVPTISVTRLGDIPLQVAEAEEPVVAVSMAIEGDLAGHTVLLFPSRTADRLAALMLPPARAGAAASSQLADSALRETGNILAGAYLNALSDFLRLSLLPSPPRLGRAPSAAVLQRDEALRSLAELAVAVETQFYLQDRRERLRAFFLLLPEPSSLHRLLGIPGARVS